MKNAISDHFGPLSFQSIGGCMNIYGEVGAFFLGFGKAMIKTNAAVGSEPTSLQMSIILDTMMENGVDGARASEVIDVCLDGLDFSQKDLGVGLPLNAVSTVEVFNEVDEDGDEDDGSGNAGSNEDDEEDGLEPERD